MNENDFHELHSPPEENVSAVIVPPTSLSEDILRQLAHERLLREFGNDNPDGDISPTMVDRALKAIKRSEILITFDPHTETIGLIEAKAFARQQNHGQQNSLQETLIEKGFSSSELANSSCTNSKDSGT